MAPLPQVPRSRCRSNSESPDSRFGGLPTRRRLQFDDSSSLSRTPVSTATSGIQKCELFGRFSELSMDLDFNGNNAEPSRQKPTFSPSCENWCLSSEVNVPHYNYGKRKNFDLNESVPTKVSRYSNSSLLGQRYSSSSNLSSPFSEHTRTDNLSPLTNQISHSFHSYRHLDETPQRFDAAMSNLDVLPQSL